VPDTYTCELEYPMSDTLSRAEAQPAGSSETPAQRRRGWSRAHTIWLLLILSLLPGVVIAFDREVWTMLPAGVRGAIYLLSAALIVAACAMIYWSGDPHADPEQSED
jgi:hypothetical protein